MNVRNTGSTMISDIRFSLIKPEGWSVEFKPDEIDHLDVGSSRSFEFIIRPDEETASGRYLITVIAESDWMRTEREIRVNVKSFQMVWLWVGVAVVCVVIAGFVVVYMRFGRR